MADLEPCQCPFCGEALTQPRDGLNYRHPDNECFIGDCVIRLDQIAAWNIRALPTVQPDPLGAEWMRREAATHVGRALDILTSGPFDASDPRIDALAEYADAIPGPIPAQLLAAALELPEIKRLREVSGQAVGHLTGYGETSTVRINLRAALAALTATDGAAHGN